MKPGFAGKNKYKPVIILISFFLFFFSFLFRDFLTKTASEISHPLVSLATSFSDNLFWWSKSRSITPHELEELYQQRSHISVERMIFEQLKDENEHLKKELNFVQRSPFSYIPANIMTKSISQTVSRFVIDVGSNQGIELGTPVLAQEGIFVGKISDVRKDSSTVTTATDLTQAIAVSLLNESPTVGVTSGTMSDLLKISFIPIDEQIQKNDLVVTSGLELSIPSGLLVGIVNTVKQEIGSPFQEAIIEPLVDIRRIDSVLVLINKQPSSP